MKQTGGDEGQVLEILKKQVAEELKVDYIVTGGWSLKASQEATRLLGAEHVNVVADARQGIDGKSGKIPEESTWKLSNNPALVYLCDNEPVNGVEFPKFPEVLAPKADGTGPIVVGDMPSNILSRRVPVKNYSAIFFGAQKNLGSTGITVAVIKKNLLPPSCPEPTPVLLRKLDLPIGPIVLSYETITKNNSFVYIAGQVLEKLLATYPDNVDGQQTVSDKKAELIYAALERLADMYKTVPDKSVRSRMNICFRVGEGESRDQTEQSFLEQSKKIGLEGLKGHRSVGGIRASNYNSIPLEWTREIGQIP